MTVAEAVITIQPDVIKLCKVMTDNSDKWFVYVFKTETLGVMLNFICHRYKGRFPHSIIVQAFSQIIDNISQTSFEMLKTL